jgi:hypothetical protein
MLSFSYLLISIGCKIDGEVLSSFGAIHAQAWGYFLSTPSSPQKGAPTGSEHTKATDDSIDSASDKELEEVRAHFLRADTEISNPNAIAERHHRKRSVCTVNNPRPVVSQPYKRTLGGATAAGSRDNGSSRDAFQP